MDLQSLGRRMGVMGKGKIIQHYKMLSPDDQRTFNRWLKANTIVGLILAAGLVAMAVIGSNSVGPRDAVVADRTKAADAVGSEQGRGQTGGVSTRKVTIRHEPF
jgi:hypothetical protein